MYSIYKLTCPNGKVYIGQTKQEHLHKRWDYGSGYKDNKTLYNDILEYGWRNFTHEVIAKVETKEEATQIERNYILQYKSNQPEYGYNKHTNESSQPKLRSYIKCVETGELFEGMAEAGQKYGVSKSAISYAIKHNSPSARKHWEKVLLTRDEYKDALS